MSEDSPSDDFTTKVSEGVPTDRTPQLHLVQWSPVHLIPKRKKDNGVPFSLTRPDGGKMRFVFLFVVPLPHPQGGPSFFRVPPFQCPPSGDTPTVTLFIIKS